MAMSPSASASFMPVCLRGNRLFLPATVRRKILLKSLGPLNGPRVSKKETNMNDQNRVLIRQGARDLNDREVAMVSGGLRTLTACTLAAAGTLDGDTFHSECGSPDQ